MDNPTAMYLLNCFENFSKKVSSLSVIQLFGIGLEILA